jgi:hypothetical protein
MLTVTYAEYHIKPFMLSVVMLNVVMMSVVMLSVVAPFLLLSKEEEKLGPDSKSGARTINIFTALIYRFS